MPGRKQDRRCTRERLSETASWRVNHRTDYLAWIQHPVRSFNLLFVSFYLLTGTLQTFGPGHRGPVTSVSQRQPIWRIRTNVDVDVPSRSGTDLCLGDHHTMADGHAPGAETAVKEGFNTYLRCDRVLGSTMVIACEGRGIPVWSTRTLA